MQEGVAVVPWKPRPHLSKPRAREPETRPSAAARGYGWKWRNPDKTGAADHFLALNPLCVECRWWGALTPATLVDHRLPHKGDRERFWNQDNWQSLCERCHNKKTAREQIAMPKFVVCGPPGSGKTTWVKQRAKQGDLIFDADYLMAAMFTVPLHTSIEFGMPLVERLRSTVVDWLLTYPDRTAFVIQTNQQRATETANALGASLIVIGADHKATTVQQITQ